MKPLHGYKINSQLIDVKGLSVPYPIFLIVNI